MRFGAQVCRLRMGTASQAVIQSLEAPAVRLSVLIEFLPHSSAVPYLRLLPEAARPMRRPSSAKCSGILSYTTLQAMVGTTESHGARRASSQDRRRKTPVSRSPSVPARRHDGAAIGAGSVKKQSAAGPCHTRLHGPSALNLPGHGRENR